MAGLIPMHVWVDVTLSFAPHTCYPGLLLSWRRVPGRQPGTVIWQGLVVTADPTARDGQLRLSQSWMDATYIRPAEAARPEPDHSLYRPVGEYRGSRGDPTTRRAK